MCQEYYLKGASRRFQGCQKKVSTLFLVGFRKFQRSLRLVLGLFMVFGYSGYDCLFQISYKLFQGRYKVVSGKFKECFKGVSRRFLRCFKEVLCCMTLIAATQAEGGLVTESIE